ncbi:MAG: tetratricopeptide repeat protein [Candidatus Omnitrophica bacterium]|nr:tetratricopeptide repeat protein [Candidatus Omnitrophota bacterium]
MRKILLIIISGLFFSLPVYSFWIWSPKTGKWKNPNYTPYGGPSLHLERGMRYFSDKMYKRALVEFRKIITYYPDAKEAPEAQFYIGKCFEELNQPYQAFMEYQKLITTYPNSPRVQEAIKSQYDIGEFFIDTKDKKVFGLPMDWLKGYPSIEIFKKIAETSPASEFAAKSLYRLGTFLMSLSRYDEAKDYFQKLLDNHPQNELVDSAKYQLAVCISKMSLSSDYDISDAKEAISNLEKIIHKNSEAEISTEATKELAMLREKEARKKFYTAEFYEKQRKFSSAYIYYNIVIENYPDTSWAKVAKERREYLKSKLQ